MKGSFTEWQAFCRGLCVTALLQNHSTKEASIRSRQPFPGTAHHAYLRIAVVVRHLALGYPWELPAEFDAHAAACLRRCA